MRLVVYNSKGGSTKTSVTINLAAGFAAAGKRVLLNDQDRMNGSLAWASISEETPFTVGRGSSPGFDIEIIDMPPNEPVKGVLPDADLYIVPTLLDGCSYVVFLRTIALLEEQGKPYLVVANRYLPRRAEHRRRLMEERTLKGAILIKERAVLSSFYERGTTVFGMNGKWAEQAQQEFVQLADAVYAKLKALADKQRRVERRTSVLPKKGVSRPTHNRLIRARKQA
jgi:cellulose biosynthesis protein BcsQ